jgi:hypothetical protein
MKYAGITVNEELGGIDEETILDYIHLASFLAICVLKYKTFPITFQDSWDSNQVLIERE